MTDTIPVLAASAPLSTRDGLLVAAIDLLQDVGYASFSFRDLAQRVGIRSASIHYHFPTKADLGVALVERLREESLGHMHEFRSEYPDVRERLIAVAEYIDSKICDRHRSCPLYALVAEYVVLPEPMQRATDRLFADRLAFMADGLDEGRRQNLITFPGSPFDQAKLLWSVFQYGSQMVRIGVEPSIKPLIIHFLATMKP
jgi:TetR/AcrR family transcriptional repressor of nem operon